MHMLFLALDVNLADPRGDAIHTRELARWMAARGNRVELVSATDGHAVPETPDGVRHHMRPRGSDWTTIRFCASLARKTGASVIYERRLSPKISFAVSRLLRIPFVVEVNGSEEEPAMLGRPDVSPWRPVKARVRRAMYQRASRVVTVTDGLGAVLTKKYKLPLGRTVTVPNGVDPARFVPMEAEDALRKLNWPSGPWILFVGNLVPWQGLEVLLRAVPHVRRKHPTVRVAIVGDGILRNSLEQLGRGLGVDGCVSFLGAVPHADIPTYIGASSMCVAPFTRARNKQIGLSPLKVYEYLSCGRPVVTSDVPGVGELIRSSDTGLTVTPDDPVELASAISDILSNPELAHALGQRARQFVASECSWARAAERIERVLVQAERMAS